MHWTKTSGNCEDGLTRGLYSGHIEQSCRLCRSYVVCFPLNMASGAVSGMYPGYFDMTYFALFPEALRKRDLKLAIVFNYQTFSIRGLAGGAKSDVAEALLGIVSCRWLHEAPAGRACRGRRCHRGGRVGPPEFSLEAEEALSAKIIHGVTTFETDIVAFLDGVDVP